jgi:integrase
MTARKVSVRVAHQRACQNANKTALDSVGRKNGCVCSPSFYTFHRDRNEQVQKGKRYQDRQFVEKLVVELQDGLNKSRAHYVEEKNIAFPDWCDKFLDEVMVVAGRRQSTIDAYAGTLRIAKEEIGYIEVRYVGPEELRRFYSKIQKTSEANRAKHLRHLAACFSAAVEEGYAATNPVPAFKKRLKLVPAKGTPPFEPVELERLLAQLAVEDESVYGALVRAAALTGARVGELVALDWLNVDLSGVAIEINGEEVQSLGSIRIAQTYSPDYGITPPKDRETRTVYLIPAAQKLFEQLVARQGAPSHGLVFQPPRGAGYVNDDYARKVVVKAMEDAGIPSEHPRTQRPRKPFHSLRATFSTQRSVEGYHPEWIRLQMGHAASDLTTDVYTTWSDEQLRAEAMRKVQTVSVVTR